MHPEIANFSLLAVEGRQGDQLSCKCFQQMYKTKLEDVGVGPEGLQSPFQPQPCSDYVMPRENANT